MTTQTPKTQHTTTKRDEFLSLFPNHVFRYIDQTGHSRQPISSNKYQKEINIDGYEPYFTVAGFSSHNSNRIEDLKNVNCFFIDIDGRKDIKELNNIEDILPPTAIVETKNGHHIYWVLDESIYKEDHTQPEFDTILARWEAIESRLVTYFNADKQVKDVTRILRVPNTYYWKKTGDLYTKPEALTEAFKTKLVSLEKARTYSMEHMEQFLSANAPETQTYTETNQPSGIKNPSEKIKEKSEMTRNEFFKAVEAVYPIEDRPSFTALLSGEIHTLPPNGSRNRALLVLASLACRAGISKKKITEKVMETGWHGMVAERGGTQEINNTIESAYKNQYTFIKTEECIAHNMTHEEEENIQNAYIHVMKDNKEKDKVRFSVYEFELLARHPYLKKNEAGIFYNYENGVYKMMKDDDVATLFFNALYDDMLWGFRTKKNLADKTATLLSIIPFIKETQSSKYVNMKNGLLNIETLTLEPHTPEHVSFIQHPFDYDAEATAPIWEKAVGRWVEGEEQEEKKAILQEFAGYCITRDMKYAKALFLIGDGGNGKSTYADTIAMMMGHEAVSRVSLEDLYDKFGIEGIIGKRLNVIEEISGNYFHAHKLKGLISGEEQMANLKYKSQFKFKPQAKFIFAVNQMPRVDDSSSGTERRILVVHFKNNFRKNPDTELRFSEGKLAQELSGIFNWALIGLRNLEKQKEFTDTEERREVIQDYREENSSVEGFISDCIEEKEGNIIKISDMYPIYREFCHKDGRTAKSKVSFSKELKMYAHKTGKFQFMPRQHGKDEAKIEGIEMSDTARKTSTYQYNNY